MTNYDADVNLMFLTIERNISEDHSSVVKIKMSPGTPLIDLLGMIEAAKYHLFSYYMRGQK